MSYHALRTALENLILCSYCLEPLNSPDCCGEDEYDPFDPLLDGDLACGRHRRAIQTLYPNADALPF